MPDLKSHGFKFTAQLMIPKAQYLDALLREKAVALFISGALIGKAVSTAIEFNRQPRGGAIEIKKIDAAWVLAAELEIVEAAIAEQTPKAFLDVSGFGAELAGETAGSIGAPAVLAVLRRSPPSSVLRTPSPPMGEKDRLSGRSRPYSRFRHLFSK